MGARQGRLGTGLVEKDQLVHGELRLTRLPDGALFRVAFAGDQTFFFGDDPAAPASGRPCPSRPPAGARWPTSSAVRQSWHRGPHRRGPAATGRGPPNRRGACRDHLTTVSCWQGFRMLL